MHLTSIARLGALAAALLGAATVCGTAGAHQIWLQQDGQAASVYFGEFGDNLREASPGLLDKFRIQSATWLAPSGSKPLQARKTAGAFVLNGKVAPGVTAATTPATSRPIGIGNLAGSSPISPLYTL